MPLPSRSRSPRRPRSAAALPLGLAAVAAVLLAHLRAPAARADEDWPVPPAEAKRESPLKAEPATLAAAKAVYEARCASCHGFGGKGDGKASGFLKVKPSDLTAEEHALDSDGEMFYRMTTGRMPMPAFEKKLSETERWQAVLHVRQLQAAVGSSSTGAAPAAPTGGGTKETAAPSPAASPSSKQP